MRTEGALTLPSGDVKVLLLCRLVEQLRCGLVSGVGVLTEVGVGQGLLGGDAVVRVQIQHLFYQVDGCRGGEWPVSLRLLFF